LALISPIKIWCWTWKFDCEKTEWHNWQKSQGNSYKQTHDQLGTLLYCLFLTSLWFA